jgi:hypothetical protein
MADKPQKQPTQTTPKGLTIPVPSREEFIRNLEKVAPKPEPSRPDDDSPSQ